MHALRACRRAGLQAAKHSGGSCARGAGHRDGRASAHQSLAMCMHMHVCMCSSTLPSRRRSAWGFTLSARGQDLAVLCEWGLQPFNTSFSTQRRSRRAPQLTAPPSTFLSLQWLCPPPLAHNLHMCWAIPPFYSRTDGQWNQILRSTRRSNSSHGETMWLRPPEKWQHAAPWLGSLSWPRSNLRSITYLPSTL